MQDGPIGRLHRRFAGIAQPSPIQPDWLDDWLEASDAMDDVMPTSSPEELISAPPELPGLIAALV